MVCSGVDHMAFPIPASSSFDPLRLVRGDNFSLGHDFVFLLLEAIRSSEGTLLIELKDLDFLIESLLEALVSRGKYFVSRYVGRTFVKTDDVSMMETAAEAAEAALASAPTRDPRRIGFKGCTSLHFLESQPIIIGLISL
jgi:hypothetical protein